jgi:hypothetical protein
VSAHAEVAWVEAGAAATATVDALAAADRAKASPGHAERVAYVKPTTDVPAARTAFDAAVAGAGLTVVDDSAGAGGGFTVTVEDGEGRRAIVVVGTSTGQILVVPRPTSRTPPGRCVAIPAPVWTATVHASGVDQEGELFRSTINWRLTTTRLLDVDGDGVLDALVPDHGKRQCPDEGTWDVYVVRGGCGHAMGTIGPGWPGLDAALVPLDRSGYRPITTVGEHADHGKKGPIPEMVTRTTVARVVGKAYRRGTTRTRTGICHHCAVSYCSTP